ncbi:cytochrome P450 [Aeromicrobium terrae]|nr:cytochrome P450 [Aeromicrobium terrae]
MSSRRPERGSLPRSWTTWFLGHGVGEGFLRLAMRRGDPIARLLADASLNADPFDEYERVRAAGPVKRTKLMSGTVSHAVASEVLRSPTFGVGGGHGELPPFTRRVLSKVMDPDAMGPMDPPSLLAVDPPAHGRYRRLVSREFTARSVTALEQRITEIAEGLLDEMARGGASQWDVVEAYASRLPVVVIADLLGVPERWQADILVWGNDAAMLLEPLLGWRNYRTAEKAVRRLNVWFDQHIENLRRDPGTDLLSRLATTSDEERLDQHELRALGLLVLGAGFETTVNLIGNGVVQLDRHRDQLELLREKPELWPNAVEEVLRHDSPVQMTLRSAYDDVEVQGQALTKGEPVVVFLGGANRDPAVFTDPQVFDVARENASDHLAFSSGAHYCLGAGLARLEGTIALRTLFERYPDLQVSGPTERRATRVLRGYEHVPVAV